MKKLFLLLFLFCTSIIYSQNLKTVQEYDKYEQITKTYLKEMLEFDMDGGGFWSGKHLSINPYSLRTINDTLLLFNIRYVTTGKEYLLIMEGDKSKILIDNTIQEIIAISDSDVKFGTIIIEDVYFSITKEIASAILICKSFEIKLKGRQFYVTAKLEEDDLKILQKFIQKY